MEHFAGLLTHRYPGIVEMRLLNLLCRLAAVHRPWVGQDCVTPGLNRA